MNNSILLFSSFGSVSLVNNSVFSDDLDNANVETQHYLHLNDDNYNVTATFYHTRCNIGLKCYKNDNLLQIGGKTPVLAFLEKYFYPAIEVIRSKVNIKKETDKIRMQLSKSLQMVNRKNGNVPVNIGQVCQLCFKENPPGKNPNSFSLQCEKCGKFNHIVCFNKENKIKRIGKQLTLFAFHVV